MNTQQAPEKVDPFSIDGRRVLLLNASEEVIAFIGWQRAATLLVSGKAVRPYNYDHAFSVRTSKGEFMVPAALILVEYVRIPHRRAYVTKKNVLRRDGYACQYCGCKVSKSSGTIDHVLPASRGGKGEWTNLVAACLRCNNRKADRTPSEAGMKLKTTPKPPEIDLVHLRAVDHRNETLWERWLVSL